MEQEYEPSLKTSPQNVRRQLLFMTPSKKIFLPQKDTEIQNTPKGKASKSRIPGVTRPKFLIDFDVESDYFLNEPNFFPKEKRDDDLVFGESLPTRAFNSYSTTQECFYESPFRTAKKTKANAESPSEYISVMKESKQGAIHMESPFCKLLNESDKFSTKSYQTLAGIDELDEEQELLKEKYLDQVQLLEKFFSYFEERSINITNIFDKESIFEIIGEERIYPLNTTLNAIAKSFLRFDFALDRFDFEYRIGFTSKSNEIIITTSGVLVGNENKTNFVLSAKILVNECLINHVRLQIA